MDIYVCVYIYRERELVATEAIIYFSGGCLLATGVLQDM